MRLAGTWGTGMDMAERWIGRGEALERLGVKSQTLYAYVSRGRIAARPDPSHPRRSLYAAADITRLSAPRADQGAMLSHVAPLVGPAVRGEAHIPSSLSIIADGRLFYRGMDAVQLAQSSTVEDVARLLWDARDASPFAGLGPRLDPVTGVNARIRLFAALARRAHEDVSSIDRDPAALKAEAASMLNEVIDAVAGPGPRLHFHQRLGRGWKLLERDSPLLRLALVLAADEASCPAAVATRMAASGGASIAGAALAGLITVAGSPGQADLIRTIALVQEARRDPARVMATRLADSDLPGFGDDRWSHGDPRATALMAASGLPADLEAVAREGQAASERKPTLNLALALLARRLDLPRDGAADLMLLGRLVGLIGHALDQVIDGSPIAARLRYVGPRPGAH
ncbi:MAG: Citrate synthase [Brevundimonas sp.]|nr:Citrate synthase [Brevundimonas sp.]